MSTTYRIAEVADRSGFTPATLRYYEDLGLLAPAGRSEAGYRLYDDSSLERLRFIARAKQLGCSLDEVADLATAWDGGRCGPVQERLRATVAAKIADSHRRIAELTSLTADLQRSAASLAAHTPAGPCDDSCGCLAGQATSARATATVAAAATTAIAVPLTTKAAAAAIGPVDTTCGCGSGPAAEDPPIACTLDATERSSRADAWAALLATQGDLQAGVTDRAAIDGGVRLTFGPQTDLADLVQLAAAEQQCCRFFRFCLTLDARGVALEVRAPAEAGDVVTALFGAPA